MALTLEQIYGLRVRSGMDAFRPMEEHWQGKDDDATYRFARAIEAEVRKQDDVLIRRLVEALEVATTPLAADRQEVLRAVTAGRARLEGKP
ncbi:MAG TPA: hypothetical protein PLE48_13505 [Thiobacillus sp.]|uniref:hypothetical protein n=1 Tax=Acidovorax sp. TaxID=1872122 RepID=UPI00262E15E8|nr:hypothetical protein [Acidovorax sp.]HQT19107.1 hypothetical protein [Acidovorax defluvii]HQT71423.1 hypothetical protein [Thiobacillus sp.]